ncbi:NACHT domain-containing protein [Micromonospora sp. NPDC004704]
MASRKLAFVDAVRLLGGDADAVGWLNRLAGVAAAAVTVTTIGAVDLFALRDELVKWGNAAVGRIRERTHGLGRFDRTQLLVAAHSVIVVTSFYEALDEVMTEIPELNLSRAELTADEQVALATKGPAAQQYAEMVASLVERPPPMPAPHLPFEEALKALEEHYRAVAGRLHAFLAGLSAFEPEPLDDAARLMRKRLPGIAVDRYAEAYRALALQAPEFGVWSGMVEGQATRAVLADAVAGLRSELGELRDAGHAAVDSVREGLGVRHRARLTRPVLSSSDAPPHATLPTLKQSYVKPKGRVAVAGPTDLPVIEAWWRDRPPVSDVPNFLFGHLTGQAAVEQPAVVLGQPGSGKSVLTQMLAAELPESDFLTIRVELRKVHADSSVQQQIERTLYEMLGEAVTWPDLVRRAGPALPVVIMDGFDELLQVTGVNRADYLEQLREFQQREAELRRPVAILVTSRTVVADRARFPHGTVVVRLEPFDDRQVATWLDVWNDVNQASLRQRGLRTLPVATVAQYGELSRQPLLLLLLALYDLGDNALQTAGGGIGRVDLYERLFADFVAREVDKHDEGRSAEQRQLEIDAEWRRLCAVAIAMLNRGGDVISETDLENDIVHLLTPSDLGCAPSDSMRRGLTVGQLLVGRFFFIHQSQASRGTGASERSFEFLHATFGEFLAARQLVNALTDLVEDRVHQRLRPGAVLDAGFLYAVTSFITVARRAPLWEFSRGFIDRLDLNQRRRCRQLVIELLADAGFLHPTWSLAGYEPRRKPVAARHATYSANLVCFAVLLSDVPVDAAELVGEPVVVRWRAQALLWESQLDLEDRQRLWQVLRVTGSVALTVWGRRPYDAAMSRQVVRDVADPPLKSHPVK